MTDPVDGRTALGHERRRCWRFGWTWLLASAVGGIGLETAHAFKVASYLDDPLARMLLRLAHAHGVGLSLAVLVFGVAGVPLFRGAAAQAVWAGRLLRTAALLIPAGFAGGAIGHAEADPSAVIFLVPVGALALVAGLSAVAWRAWRAPESGGDNAHGAD